MATKLKCKMYTFLQVQVNFLVRKQILAKVYV